jgi:hypothetical protein
MSTVREQDHLDHNDPADYAPRRLRDGSDLRLSPSRETSSRQSRPPVSAPASSDTSLEEAVFQSLRRPLDPEVINEPPEFVHELDRRIALIRVARRFGAAVGVSALLALFFVIMVPASRDYAQQPDSGASTFSRIVQSIRTTLYQEVRRDDASRPALSEFQPVPASTPTSSPVMTHEQSEALLQQFLQWRQKTAPTKPSQ